MKDIAMDRLISDFTDYVMKKAGISEEYKITDYDLDRVYLDVGNDIDNYTIRMWDMRLGYIRFTLYRQEDNHGISVLSGSYTFEVDISEEEFNLYFLDNILRNGLFCFETGGIGADNYANYIIDNFILPITEWDEEVIREKNHITVFFWYLNYIYYLNFDRDNAVGAFTDDIYQFLDAIEIR